MTKEIVYLTGAPAAGKTTLANNLVKNRLDVSLFEYGRAMAHHLTNAGKTNSELALSELRRGTEGRVTPADIKAVNDLLKDWVKKNRASRHLIVESHHLTIEEYGFRAVLFDKATLLELQFTQVWLVVCDRELTLSRILANPQGRLHPTPFRADLHTYMQAAIAVDYAVASNCPLYTFDTSSNDLALWERAGSKLEQR